MSKTIEYECDLCGKTSNTEMKKLALCRYWEYDRDRFLFFRPWTPLFALHVCDKCRLELVGEPPDYCAATESCGEGADEGLLRKTFDRLLDRFRAKRVK